MLSFAVCFLIFCLVIGVASIGSRDRGQQDYENYHHDPYYYYPRNQPPPYFSGYQPQPMQPYYQPQQPPMRYPTMRPQPAGGSFITGLLLFMITTAFLFGLAVKMNMVSLQLTIGNPGPQQELRQRNRPSMPTDEPGNENTNPVAYAKN